MWFVIKYPIGDPCSGCALENIRIQLNVIKLIIFCGVVNGSKIDGEEKIPFICRQQSDK